MTVKLRQRSVNDSYRKAVYTKNKYNGAQRFVY